tara:strand:+ start:146 stop:376 length:231 start_codon:yes stop_codon:yes gene_type:complete
MQKRSFLASAPKLGEVYRSHLYREEFENPTQGPRIGTVQHYRQRLAPMLLAFNKRSSLLEKTPFHNLAVLRPEPSS